jgi:hypothetical protein
MSQLSPLALQAIEHWKKHLPNLYASLKEKGLLVKRAQKAADQTNEDLENAVSQGVPWHNAWDEVKNRYVFLPREEEQARQEKEDEANQPDWDAI